VFREKPLLGVGAGAFAAAVEPVVGARASHNVFLAVLVEQGIVGFLTFAALLLACAWRISHAPAQQRRFWTIIAITWLIGALSLSWQSAKITWLLISLLSTGAVRGTRRPQAAPALPQPRRRDFGDVRGLPQPS
jgi:O-antigen ligase